MTRVLKLIGSIAIALLAILFLLSGMIYFFVGVTAAAEDLVGQSLAYILVGIGSGYGAWRLWQSSHS